MKTRNLILGLGIVAGTLLTVTALNKRGNKVKEYVSKSIKKVNFNKAKKENKDELYV